MDSSYLYSSENRELYKETLDSFNRSDCVHGRNLIAFFDGTDNSSSLFLDKHLGECSICQKKLRNWKNICLSIEKEIPLHHMAEEEELLMKGECRRVLELLRVKKFSRVHNGPNLSTQITQDLFQSLVSKEFIFGFCFAGLSALIIYFFRY